MTSLLRNLIPNSSPKEDFNDNDKNDYNAEYSFAMEYTGPLLIHDIPQVVPLDVRRIPTAAIAVKITTVSHFSLPVIQPIPKKSTNSTTTLPSSTNLENRTLSSTSSGTLGFSDNNLNDSNCVSGSSGFEDLSKDLENDGNNHSNSIELTLRSQELSSCESLENCVAAEASNQGNRTAVVTFRDLHSNDSYTEEETDLDEEEIVQHRPVVSDLKKGLCLRCNKRNRFSEKEVCIVCGAKYCSKCVFRAMGSMPEGRKCIPCIGYRIDESKRGSLGKCSGMLMKLLTNDAIKQIMSSEISCGVNQLPPNLVVVNNKALSIDELVLLQSCPNPPKKLRPGRYWYDKVSGYWGKEGEKPLQIISADLPVGYPIQNDASNGNTNVRINNREITKAEIWMLKAAGIRYEGNPSFWVTSDGSCQLEGMNYVMGKLWEKKRVQIVCTALSLPFPSNTLSSFTEEVAKETSKVNLKNQEQRMMNKILLVGCDHSGTSTIYKQAKILYKVPFSEDEKQNIKYVIQKNLYSYIAILLEGHQHFEEDYLVEMRGRSANEPSSSSGNAEIEEKNIYSFKPQLKAFSSWLLQIMMSGNLEAIFPAATREYSPLVEELWKDQAFQTTYKRRSELRMLPRVANYFLDRAVEISRMDYEPSEMDMLYAEGITSSNGVASMEFTFPKSSQDGYMEPLDQNDPLIRFQLIRVHTSSLGEKLKWLEMFEDVDLVIFCVSLTEYDEYHEDIKGNRTNKLLATKKLFQTIVTHPNLAEKHFLVILNKFDLLEEKIEQVPLNQCEWFQDFTPVISHNPHTSSNNNNNTSLAQRAFHFIAVKFKRLFTSLTGQKLFVSKVTGLESDSVDLALKYGKEILRWDDERRVVVSTNEFSTESIEHTSSM